ncbi:MAG: tetratricopeptide repeat protein [Crocinitomicaceae bacterium]|nr:tetratricopeptide repeat protein [Crocinitomicaceae bacterium]
MKSLLLCGIILISFATFSQTDQEKKDAIKIAQKAIKLMDDGEIKKSIKMLKEAIKLDGTNFNFPYEIGLAYYKLENYKKSIEYLTETLSYDDITDQCYTMLGNAYDMNGDPDRAIEIYDDGLKVFPRSGRLYYEKGVVERSRDNLDVALGYWTKGIFVRPTYASNYYMAAHIYCSNTEEEIWGMLYGEIMMNIERTTGRTNELSKLLYDTYNSAISISGDEASVSFSQEMSMSLPGEGEEMKLPFQMHYEMTTSLSVAAVMNGGDLSIADINQMRTTFIETWFEQETHKQYPNFLFNFHKKLMDLGYFECYNYWVLMKGNESEFESWVAEHDSEFEEFIKWFKDHPLAIDDKNSFHHSQYD